MNVNDFLQPEKYGPHTGRKHTAVDPFAVVAKSAPRTGGTRKRTLAVASGLGHTATRRPAPTIP